MKRHMKDAHQILVKKETCPICFVTIKSRNIKEHMEKIHSNVNLKCNDCGIYKSSSELLRKHIKYKHLMEKKFTSCYICGKQVSTLSHNQHIKMHLTTEKKFECPICKKMFFTISQRNTHKLSHNEKTLLCKDCDFKTHRADNLRRHIILHSETFPYTCTYCDDKFKFKLQLDYHTKIHTGVKDIKCRFCDKLFRTLSLRSKHENIHTKNYKARCEECKKDFIQKSNYHSHLRNHHNVK